MFRTVSFRYLRLVPCRYSILNRAVTTPCTKPLQEVLPASFSSVSSSSVAHQGNDSQADKAISRNTSHTNSLSIPSGEGSKNHEKFPENHEKFPENRVSFLSEDDIYDRYLALQEVEEEEVAPLPTGSEAAVTMYRSLSRMPWQRALATIQQHHKNLDKTHYALTMKNLFKNLKQTPNIGRTTFIEEVKNDPRFEV